MKGFDDRMQVFHFKEERPMLVLTRKVGEQIRIGTDIVLTVLEVAGHRVRLGVEAPRAVPVLRAELQGSVPEQASGEVLRLAASSQGHYGALK